jgi:NADP-reducing hydrogenase subunit HndB
MAAKKKLSIQDLAKIREKTKSLMTIREGEGRARVTIHMGTCGIAAGARDIMDALLGEIDKAKVQDIIVTTSGCAGLCNAEPMATVEFKNQPPVKYGFLTPEKVRKIFVQHILGGQMVTELVLAVGSETVY